MRAKARSQRPSRPSRPAAKRRGSRRRPITPQDLRRIHFVSDANISPDGDTVVFVRKEIGERPTYWSDLWTVATDGKSEARRFTAGGKDRVPRWSPDGTQVAFVGGREAAKPQIYLIGRHGGEAAALTRFPEGSIGAFAWSPDGARLAVSFREEDPEWSEAAKKARRENEEPDPPRVIDDWWYRLDGDGYFAARRFHIYLVDVATGEHRLLYDKDVLGGATFDWSPDGRELVVATNRDRKALIRPWKDELVRIHAGTGKIRAIPKLPEGPKTAPRWSPDGKRIAYLGRLGTDGVYSVENLHLFVCDPAQGKARDLMAKTDYCLLANPVTDTAEVGFMTPPLWNRNSREVFVQIGWHGESHVASVNLRGQVTLRTEGPFDMALGNRSADGTRLALTVASSTRPAEAFLGVVNKTNVRPVALTACNESLLGELDLVKPRSVWVRTPDGTRVQTWVLLPPAASRRRRMPAVLEVHGGPHAQYGVGFFHEMHLLAAQGYVVFYSNPRGSKGYGRDHCAAIRGAWGTADWVDIQAVADYMEAQSFVDPKRLAIMGGSYGGYMTNWAIGHTTRFRAAITDRCVSNLVSMAGNSDFIEAPDDYFPGNFWDKPEARWEQSPIRYFGNVRTPTLIIHSEGDLRCNVEQADQVFTALKLRNVPTRFVRYPRSTSHGMSRMGPPALRIHRLEQILGWLETYLKRTR